MGFTPSPHLTPSASAAPRLSSRLRRSASPKTLSLPPKLAVSRIDAAGEFSVSWAESNFHGNLRSGVGFNKQFQYRKRYWTSYNSSSSIIPVALQLQVNQSIKIYFPSNNKQLQYNKCYSTWKATMQRSITLIKTGRLNKTTTQILIHKKNRKETGAETNISMCNSSTSTYTINSKSTIQTSWFFYYIKSQIENNFNIFQKDYDAVLLKRLLGRRFQRWWNKILLYYKHKGQSVMGLTRCLHIHHL